jgi:hypothetical protein
MTDRASNSYNEYWVYFGGLLIAVGYVAATYIKKGIDRKLEEYKYRCSLAEEEEQRLLGIIYRLEEEKDRSTNKKKRWARQRLLKGGNLTGREVPGDIWG